MNGTLLPGGELDQLPLMADMVMNPSATARIMVVDDVAVNLRLLETLLRTECAEVMSHTSPLAALAAAAQRPPDLILLDIDMPEMDGYELCRRFKGDPRLGRIPILFLSGFAGEAEKVRGFAVGGVDYITKPFSLEEVRARVSSHLKLQALQNRLETHSQNLEKVVHSQMHKLAESQMTTIFALAKLAEYRDQETGDHLERVREFCRILAQELRSSAYAALIDEHFVASLAQASVLHDIGKVAIPDAVLFKPARLDPEERVIIERHTTIGAETLEAVHRLHPENIFIRIGIDIARSHHEKWDGTGYPQGLAKAAIPLAARIMTVVDIYDALRTERCYKRGWPHAEVVAEIVAHSGKDFDPEIVAAFLRVEEAIAAIYDLFT